MALAKEAVTGMRDITPAEMQIREYVMNQIKETYKSFGFTQIETPCVEHIGNLTSKQGGDNEKLIFKILKRGDKLNLEGSKEENDLVDSGLRYDLTCLFPATTPITQPICQAPLRPFRWAACGVRTVPRRAVSASLYSVTLISWEMPPAWLKLS